jgi:hypothetical protein
LAFITRADHSPASAYEKGLVAIEEQEIAMSNNDYNHGYKTGLNGGKVNTNGMPSQQKESTDAGVNKGNADRGNK